MNIRIGHFNYFIVDIIQSFNYHLKHFWVTFITSISHLRCTHLFYQFFTEYKYWLNDRFKSTSPWATFICLFFEIWRKSLQTFFIFMLVLRYRTGMIFYFNLKGANPINILSRMFIKTIHVKIIFTALFS